MPAIEFVPAVHVIIALSERSEWSRSHEDCGNNHERG